MKAALLRALSMVWTGFWLGIAGAVCIRGCSRTLEILDPKPRVAIENSFNSLHPATKPDPKRK